MWASSFRKSYNIIFVSLEHPTQQLAPHLLSNTAHWALVTALEKLSSYRPHIHFRQLYNSGVLAHFFSLEAIDAGTDSLSEYAFYGSIMVSFQCEVGVHPEYLLENSQTNLFMQSTGLW